MSDIIVEENRRIRDELIKQYGGTEGYFKHCQAQERASRHRTGRRKPSTSKSRKGKNQKG